MLSPQQIDFLLAFQRAMGKVCGPVTVNQIAMEWGKSDTRVRAHLKRLIPQGYVVFVGKTRWKQYVAGFSWASEDEANLDLCYNLGGGCETRGCEGASTVCFRGRYLCRDCMMNPGSEPVSDIEWYSAKSSMAWFEDV